MTQVDWVKQFEQTFGPMFEDLGDGQLDYANERVKDFIQSQITLAQQRTEKKWREKCEKNMYPQEYIDEAKPFPETWEKMINHNAVLSDLLK